MSKEIGKEITDKFYKLEEAIVNVIEDGDYSEKTAGPVLALLYAETCKTIDMPFEKAVHYVLHVLAKVYDVELVKVESEDVTDDEEIVKINKKIKEGGAGTLH